MEDNLIRVHKKWKSIQHEIDMRKHAATMEKKAGGDQLLLPQAGGRVAKALFSKGGSVEKLMRRVYQEGLEKLKNNSFESNEEKKEWEDFRDNLDPSELEVVTSRLWQ
jgi:hypothetical protein